MIQLKPIVIKGDVVTKNGAAHYTIQDEIEKQVNPILAKLGSDALKVDFNLLNEKTALVVITVENDGEKTKKLGK